MARVTRVFAIAVLFCAWSGTSAQDSGNGTCNSFGFGEEQEEKWGNCYPSCNGKYQSPINIELEDVIIENLTHVNGPFYADRYIPFNFSLTNDNYTVTLELLDGDYLFLEGGPLGDRYFLKHLQFCWGSNDSDGSEHTIDNETYAMEGQWGLYLKNYSSYEEASKHPGGVLRIAQLYPIQKEDNPSMEPIVQALSDIVEPYQSTTPNKTLTYDNLFSGYTSDDYYHYNGSFTTPPCSETVKWFVYPPMNGVSERQVAAFRTLKSTDGPLVNNVRSVQPLNGRHVIRSDKSSTCLGYCETSAKPARRGAGRRHKATKSGRRRASKHRGASRRHHH